MAGALWVTGSLNGCKIASVSVNFPAGAVVVYFHTAGGGEEGGKETERYEIMCNL